MTDLLPVLVDLVDDAGPLDAAVTRSLDPSGSPVLTDRVLVEASGVDALDALVGRLGSAPGVVPVVLAAGSAADAADAVHALRARPRARLAAVRVPLPRDPAAVRPALPPLPVTVDVQVLLDVEEVVARPSGAAVLLDALAGEGLDPVVDASATPDALATLLAGAVREGLAVTVRGVGGVLPADGAVGLLGLLVATARAVECRPHQVVAAALTGTDAEGLAQEVTLLDDELALQVRAQLRSVESVDPAGLLAALLELVG